MKRILLVTLILILGVAVMAQQKPVTITKTMQNRTMPSLKVLDNEASPAQPGNTVVNSKAVLDDIIGGSRYDMQTNASIQNNRVALWPDGTVSASWTMAFTDPNYGDRGTGYNYNNGTAWNPAPTTRIETMKSGWPSVHPWNGGGEMIMAHNVTTHLVMNSRPVKGTGSWTQNVRLTAPTGVPAITWPRTVTSGANHQYIHVLVLTEPTANGGTVYQGLDGALLYYRSLDGGATWDKQGVILPGLTSANYFGFGGDDYAWAEPHGDTLVFINGGNWTDTFIMKSTDNGNTWTKTVILPNYYSKNSGTTVTPSFICDDGSNACEIDKNGVIHVAFGRMRATNDGTGHKYFPGMDGIVYWNSTMPVLDTAVVSDINELINQNLCLGYVVDNGNPNDTIINFPAYGVSLSSFPQITIDDYNNIYFLWSSLTVGNPSPDQYNYRHIWARAWFHDKPSWNEMTDLNSNFLYLFQEYVYPSVANRLKNNKIQMISQTSSQPGANIKDTTIPIHDVNIEYREVPVSTFFPTGIENNTVTTKNPVSQNYPNPVKGATFFNLNLDKAANVTIEVSNIMGQKIMSLDKGVIYAGIHKMTIDGSVLSSGIYFYTVKINNDSYTHKMIVE
ncbi:MAG: T9SS type A sorting domain-containing protein [Bacteroidales bacterium]|nr:T9SS type A sorting domain-containing protein [Bacteroidales bacterium]